LSSGGASAPLDVFRSARDHATLRIATLLGTAAFLFDWATKSWALHYVDGSSIPLGALMLRVARNEAFAFSASPGEVSSVLVLAVRVTMILAIVVLSRRLALLLRRRTACGAALLLAGGLGNSVDLMFRDGAVVDFIWVGPFSYEWAGEPVQLSFVFNAADVIILIGIGLLAPMIRDLGRDLQRRIANWERGLLAGARPAPGAREPGSD
jgi:lipoprotein signal peptidase